MTWTERLGVVYVGGFVGMAILMTVLLALGMVSVRRPRVRPVSYVLFVLGCAVLWPAICLGAVVELLRGIGRGLRS